MIGLSLSFCVSDICRGKVALQDVEKIIAGTCVHDRDELEDLIVDYQEWYWSDFPKEAAFVTRCLWENGKIEQPRLKGEEARNIAHGHWENC